MGISDEELLLLNTLIAVSEYENNHSTEEGSLEHASMPKLVDHASRTKCQLTKTEKAALRKEVMRIAALEGKWEPTMESMSEVMLAVKRAVQEEQWEKQRRGISQAREAGVALGRPRKVPPENLGELIAQVDTRRTSTVALARDLGVSRETLRQWIKKWRAENDIAHAEGNTNPVLYDACRLSEQEP